MAQVLVWGAAGGIGQALAGTFWAAGHHVVAVARRAGGLPDGVPVVIAQRVEEMSEVAAAMHEATRWAASFDVFIYAVGDILSAKVGEMSIEAWQSILNANLTGAYVTTQAALPHLTPQAHLFFLGAQHERLRLPGLGAYAASKAGLEALAEVIRKETRRRVCVVRPQAVDTAFWQKVPFRLPPRALTPAQLAEAVFKAWLEGREGLLDV